MPLVITDANSRTIFVVIPKNGSVNVAFVKTLTRLLARIQYYHDVMHVKVICSLCCESPVTKVAWHCQLICAVGERSIPKPSHSFGSRYTTRPWKILLQYHLVGFQEFENQSYNIFHLQDMFNYEISYLWSLLDMVNMFASKKKWHDFSRFGAPLHTLMPWITLKLFADFKRAKRPYVQIIKR